MKRRALYAGVALGTLLISAGAATAGGFALREQSATSQGASFAGAATPGDGISAMFWNPAAVTNTDHLTSESHHTFIKPNSTLDISASALPLAVYGDGGELGIDAWIPAGYTAYKVNDSLYLGLSINAPYGLATHSTTPSVIQTDNLAAKVFSTTVTPTIGYKVNDQLSIGLGAQIQYFKVGITRATSTAVNPTKVELTGDDFGFGLTAGVTYKPFEGTELALGFRSAIAQNLEGDLITATTSPIDANITLPESINFGVRQKIDDKFTLLGTVEWTNWSRVDSIPVTLQASGATATELEFEYKDGWFFAVGGEYAWNDQLTLRAGVAYEISPVEDRFRSARLPDSNRIWASIGASYQFNEALSIDAGYTHIFGEEAPINVTTGATYSATANSHVDILSVALKYKM